MALFYPATFGIVGQKMTTLQHRSQGDPEDPHDEHYLLATQSKQEQVCECSFYFSLLINWGIKSRLISSSKKPKFVIWARSIKK